MRKFFSFFAIAAVVLGMVSCEGNDPEMTKVPEGAINGVFTVSADSTQVYFSQGNVQAMYNGEGEGWTWAFADNQWDFIGNYAANTIITGNATVSYRGTVDMFGWSTEKTYYGIYNSVRVDDYEGGFEDWGKNFGTGWRTLQREEWIYVFMKRDRAGELFGLGTVNNVKGIILLPDNWKMPQDVPEFHPGVAMGIEDKKTYYRDYSNLDHYPDNIYTIRQWFIMESAGAVFLPATGERNGVEVTDNPDGRYWSATPRDLTRAYAVGSSAKDVNPDGTASRYYGFAVRLVQDVK